MDVNDSCRLCFGNLRIDGKLRVLASWEQHSAGVLRHRHERPPPFAPTNLSLLLLARTRSYRCKHSTENKGQTIGVEPSLAEARRMAREASMGIPRLISQRRRAARAAEKALFSFLLFFFCSGDDYIPVDAPQRDASCVPCARAALMS